MKKIPMLEKFAAQSLVEHHGELIFSEVWFVALLHTPETEECEYSWLIHNKIKEHFGVDS